MADEQSLDVPRKSPGFLGLGPRTPPIKEEGGAFSPPLEQPQAQRSYSQSGGQSGAGGAGVQRKKSLMQKIKTMVRPRSQSVEGGGGAESGPSHLRPHPVTVVSGPMAGPYGNATSPGLSEGVLEEDEQDDDEAGAGIEEEATRGRRRDQEGYADEDVFGMSPEPAYRARMH